MAVYAVSASIEKLLLSHLMVRSTGKKQFSNNLVRWGLDWKGDEI